ncbi:GDSL esterase/lipase At5g45960 isoform X2 [Juglans microcarpa x Juglans regia]|uniref:GDSL esterase/lipase At5g45960 isoform X2 n=1 Tax=Juglans microcarpa x Juglans regia TaxID=2249226 RepID=UPI001B7DA028|nr:GDSL esterase/lipase At5g45960 isoform X2 [Juglans microcarpa x Juglans regia]
MEGSFKHKLPLPLVLLSFLVHISGIISINAQGLSKQGTLNKNISALLVFGDSTVDSGNNNFVSTAFKSNFPPYGREFPNQMPTGRFTDGRLCTDFIASYVGIKEDVPPYLDPTLSMKELMTGVSFASAGTGYDPLTATLGNVIPISKQLEYFRDYKKRLESSTGKQRTKEHIKNALFVVSAGTNDFVVNYFVLPTRRKSYTVSSYQQFLLQQCKELIQGLWEEGARKILVAGLPPMGCLPILITLFSSTTTVFDHLQRGCLEQYSSVARDYNGLLQNDLNFMQLSLASHGARIFYLDIYGPLIHMIEAHESFGYMEASFLCNPMSYVCSDASKYIFWDSIHPTEKTYYNIFKGTIRPIIDLIISN